MLKTWMYSIGLKSKLRIDSYLILEELLYCIPFLMFWLLMATGKCGRIDLKSKRLNSFMVNNSSLSQNPMKNCYSSSIRWEPMPIFDFNSIPPCLQQWLSIITETSKIQCRMVIPQVFDENLCLFEILTRFLHVFSEGYQ